MRKLVPYKTYKVCPLAHCFNQIYCEMADANHYRYNPAIPLSNEYICQSSLNQGMKNESLVFCFGII